MTTAIYAVRVDGETRFTFGGNFAQASSPITLDGDSTPFQVADARHRPANAAKLLIDWCASEGGSAVGDDEEYEVDEIEEAEVVR